MYVLMSCSCTVMHSVQSVFEVCILLCAMVVLLCVTQCVYFVFDVNISMSDI